MHRLSYLVTLGSILCAATHCLAATGPDSPVAVSLSDNPTQAFILRLERDIERTVVYLEPHADGMVAITTADGRVEYVPLYRILHIEDSNGADRTSEVTRRGHRLGSPVPKPTHAPEGWKRYRLRAGSPSECGSYLITDFALMWLGTPHEYPLHDQEIFGTLDCGYARNVGRSNSIGGSVFLGVDGIRTHAGLRLHLYSWPAPNVSFDVAPGIVLLADDEGTSRFIAPGFSGQAGLTFGGRFGFVAQVFSVKRREYVYETTDTAMHVGFRLGAEPGIIGSSAFLIAEGITSSTHGFAPKH